MSPVDKRPLLAATTGISLPAGAIEASPLQEADELAGIGTWAALGWQMSGKNCFTLCLVGK